MNADSPSSPPVELLGRGSSSWPDLIASYPRLLVQVRTQAARAVRILDDVDRAPSGHGLTDLNGGFFADLANLSAAYTIGEGPPESEDTRLEFDFPDCPGLVCFWDLFSRDHDRLPVAMRRFFSEGQISIDDLQKRRETEFPPRPLCPCCREKAEERGRYASMHPLFDILMHAAHRREDLQLRVMSPYADLSLSIVPHHVSAESGLVSAMDKEQSAAFDIDVRCLHAMRINRVELDGICYSLLIGYNSFGSEIFHLASPDPAAADAWSRCCEWSQQFFSP